MVVYFTNIFFVCISQVIKQTPLVEGLGPATELTFGCHFFSSMKSAWIVYLGFVLGAGHIVSTASVEHEPEGVQDKVYVTPVSSVVLYETTTNGTSGNHSKDTDTFPTYVGFITAGVAVIFYGSNFVPVKKFETGDGM